MISTEPLKTLPVQIQQDFMAQLQRSLPTDQGVFQLVNIRETDPAGYESQRIIVLVIDENGIPMPSVNVAFSYSTANPYYLTPETKWVPPAPQKAFIVPTHGSGEIDQVQGSAVKAGEPGGVTVYVFEPEYYASDVVTGCGMLADHTGLHLTFRLDLVGVKSYDERLTALEALAGLGEL